MATVFRGRAYWCAAFAPAAIVLVSAAPAFAGHHAARHARHHKAARHSKDGQTAAPQLYATTADTAVPTAKDLPLPTGGFRFWQAPTVSSGTVPHSSLCGLTGPCYTWSMPVASGGWRLRVALDTPLRSNEFELDVIDPSGNVTSATNIGNFDSEVYILHPAGGVWTIRVMPQDVSYSSFRMRAKLETQPPPMPKVHIPLLPELRADPPLEFTFTAPANPANGLYPPDTLNPPLDVLGVHPLSCGVDEMAPSAVQGGNAQPRCLRFTSGPMNVGRGVYEMHWKYVSDVVNGKLNGGPTGTGPIYQTIHYEDGTTSTRPGGRYEFHFLHGHFHDDGILDMKLFHVNADNTLTQVGIGVKSGFCPADELIGVWRSFANGEPNQVSTGDSGTGNCQNPVDGVLGQSPGWGDTYRWQRPGMYVQFGNSPDGLYVVRITVDPHRDVLQSSYAYSSSYALVKVVGDSITELERGQGLSPFDPHKIVFTGSGPGSQN